MDVVSLNLYFLVVMVRIGKLVTDTNLKDALVPDGFRFLH